MLLKRLSWNFINTHYYIWAWPEVSGQPDIIVSISISKGQQAGGQQRWKAEINVRGLRSTFCTITCLKRATSQAKVDLKIKSIKGKARPHWLAVVVKVPCTAENATEPQVSEPVWYESHSEGLATRHVRLGEDVEKNEQSVCYLLPDNYRQYPWWPLLFQWPLWSLIKHFYCSLVFITRTNTHAAVRQYISRFTLYWMCATSDVCLQGIFK